MRQRVDPSFNENRLSVQSPLPVLAELAQEALVGSDELTSISDRHSIDFADDFTLSSPPTARGVLRWRAAERRFGPSRS
jgi:hypothetical protein